MSDQTAELLLQEFRAFRDNEFREFRDDVAAWKQDSGERLKALETTVEDGLIDNGQPSRLTAVERKVSVLERVAWIASGVLLATQAVVGILIEWHPWGNK
jgi:hypothetical protein